MLLRNCSFDPNDFVRLAAHFTTDWALCLAVVLEALLQFHACALRTLYSWVIQCRSKRLFYRPCSSSFSQMPYKATFCASEALLLWSSRGLHQEWPLEPLVLQGFLFWWQRPFLSGALLRGLWIGSGLPAVASR